MLSSIIECLQVSTCLSVYEYRIILINRFKPLTLITMFILGLILLCLLLFVKHANEMPMPELSVVQHKERADTVNQVGVTSAPSNVHSRSSSGDRHDANSYESVQIDRNNKNVQPLQDELRALNNENLYRGKLSDPDRKVVEVDQTFIEVLPKEAIDAAAREPTLLTQEQLDQSHQELLQLIESAKSAEEK